MLAISTGLFSTLTTPEICGHDWPLLAPQITSFDGEVELARGANRDWNSGPGGAVASLEAICVFTRLPPTESSSNPPAPSHPAPLLTMMLLVTLAEFQ